MRGQWVNVINPLVNWLLICTDNDMPPTRGQAINWTNAELLLTGILGTNCSVKFIYNTTVMA